LALLEAHVLGAPSDEFNVALLHPDALKELMLLDDSFQCLDRRAFSSSVSSLNAPPLCVFG
jgi:hypothetical protein